MENSGLLNWKYVEVFVFDPAISPRSLVLGTFDEERSKERWLFSQASSYDTEDVKTALL